MKTFSLSVEPMILNVMSLFSDDPSDQRKTLVAGAESRSQRLAGWLFRHFLPQKEFALGERKNGSLRPMTLASSRRFKRRESPKSARLDFELPLTTALRKSRLQKLPKRELEESENCQPARGQKRGTVQKTTLCPRLMKPKRAEYRDRLLGIAYVSETEEALKRLV